MQARKSQVSGRAAKILKIFNPVQIIQKGLVYCLIRLSCCLA